MLLYGLQHSVRSAAERGGDQIRERVLRVGRLGSRKHGEDSPGAVAVADEQLGALMDTVYMLRGDYKRARNSCRGSHSPARTSGWLLGAAVAVSGAEQGSADDVV